MEIKSQIQSNFPLIKLSKNSFKLLLTNEPRYGILQTNQERGAYVDKFYRVEVWKTIADPKTNITYLQQEQQDGHMDMSKEEDKEQYKTILRSCVKKVVLYFCRIFT